jgi:hypothetical protein
MFGFRRPALQPVYMDCPHPSEELRRVFAGQAAPVPGRWYCALCGALVYAESGQPGNSELVRHSAAAPASRLSPHVDVRVRVRTLP